MKVGLKGEVICGRCTQYLSHSYRFSIEDCVFLAVFARDRNWMIG